MTIDSKPTFYYETTLDYGTASGWGGVCESVSTSSQQLLLGQAPCLAIENDAFYLQPSEDALSSIRCARLITNYNLGRNLEIGDQLFIAQDRGAHLSIALIREKQLIWAFGEVNSLPFPELLSTEPVPNLLVDVRCLNEVARLHEGKHTRLNQHFVGLAKRFYNTRPSHGPSVAVVDLDLNIQPDDALSIARSLGWKMYRDLKKEFSSRNS